MTARLAPFAMIAPLAVTLAACDTKAPAPEPIATETQVPEAQATESIFNSDVGVEAEPVLLEPYRAIVGFPDGGATLDRAAIAELTKTLQSPQIKGGGRILLRGHSDAGGTDAANMRASQARADAVRDWFTDNGVAETRIETLAFGEQNPIEPNARPDGTPNEAGRALNRRVSVTVGVPNDTTNLSAEPEEVEETPEPEPTSEALFPLTD